jgi:hypothetical protein
VIVQATPSRLPLIAPNDRAHGFASRAPAMRKAADACLVAPARSWPLRLIPVMNPA